MKCHLTGHKRDLGWMSGLLRRKNKSSTSSQEVENEHRNKAKNLQSYLSEMMKKLKHPFKKEKPQHDKRSLSPTNKNHFFLERIIPPNRSHDEQHYDDIENHDDLAASEQVQIVDEVEASDGGEAQEQPLCSQLQEENKPMDAKESVFKYVKTVLDAIDSSWEELYLNTGLSDQILNPALISNIPFYPNELCADHELVFDLINEALFDFCRFPRWVKPTTQGLSYSVESIVGAVQEKVYSQLLPLQLPQEKDQIAREEIAQPKNWLDIRCGLECVGFETSEIILDELLEELMFEL